MNVRCKQGRVRIAFVNDLDTTSPSPNLTSEADIGESLGYEPASSKDRSILFKLAIPILIADQLSKWWVVENIPLNERFVPIPALYPYFKFTHVANTGAIFGTLSNARLWLTILAVIVTIGLLIYNFMLPMASRKLRVALGMVFGGAIGNLLDRIRFGHVTDFVDLDFSSIIPLRIADWYIWNIADLAIISAIILMAYLTFFEPEQIERPAVVKPSEDDIAGAGALKMLESAPVATSSTTPSDEFQSAAEIASIKTDIAQDEALDMLDLGTTPSSATEIVDLHSENTEHIDE